MFTKSALPAALKFSSTFYKMLIMDRDSFYKNTSSTLHSLQQSKPTSYTASDIRYQQKLSRSLA